MKHIRNIFLTICLFSAFSCSDFLDPEADNTRDGSILDETAYFCGPLNDVYNNLPTLFDVKMDMLTDNAVKRDFLGDYYRCGTGAMSPALNPLDIWTKAYANIRTLNIFLSRMVLDESTEWKTPVRFFQLSTEADYEDNINMFWRLKGEAYVLRAYWMSELLRTYGGEAEDGRILGVPLVGDRILDISDDLNIERAAYDACVEAIVADCDRAINECNLPDVYGKDNPQSRVYGNTIKGHVSGAAAKAIKARVLLYAASPAFNRTGSQEKWERAANAAADAINALGGINVAFASRDEYYFTQISNYDWNKYDVVMRAKILPTNSELETEHFPPGMYGQAQLNVSQNFVDAFPDKYGYPINESSVYNPNLPYAERDPRLTQFVGYDGSAMGSYVLQIAGNGPDAYDPLKRTSRSGYYLKKTLRPTLNLRPGHATTTPRANIIIGLPELFLSFAEAANEAWGPDGADAGFSAKEALRKILLRGNADGARYMDEQIGSDSGRFRDYVRLQRRLELSFEGHYYYDLRRWYAADDDWQSKINTTVYGVEISEDNGYKRIELEKRHFVSPYPPIPYTEVFNAPAIVQNKGWN